MGVGSWGLESRAFKASRLAFGVQRSGFGVEGSEFRGKLRV